MRRPNNAANPFGTRRPSVYQRLPSVRQGSSGSTDWCVAPSGRALSPSFFYSTHWQFPLGSAVESVATESVPENQARGSHISRPVWKPLSNSKFNSAGSGLSAATWLRKVHTPAAARHPDQRPKARRREPNAGENFSPSPGLCLAAPGLLMRYLCHPVLTLQGSAWCTKRIYRTEAPPFSLRFVSHLILSFES